MTQHRFYFSHLDRGSQHDLDSARQAPADMTRDESVDTAPYDCPLPDITDDEDFRSVIKKLSLYVGIHLLLFCFRPGPSLSAPFIIDASSLTSRSCSSPHVDISVP